MERSKQRVRRCRESGSGHELELEVELDTATGTACGLREGFDCDEID